MTRKTLRFIRLRQNTPELTAGMNGEANRAVAHRAKAGRLRRNFAIPRCLQRGASLQTARWGYVGQALTERKEIPHPCRCAQCRNDELKGRQALPHSAKHVIQRGFAVQGKASS
jgi:hypothetical protein